MIKNFYVTRTAKAIFTWYFLKYVPNNYSSEGFY